MKLPRIGTGLRQCKEERQRQRGREGADKPDRKKWVPMGVRAGEEDTGRNIVRRECQPCVIG